MAIDGVEQIVRDEMRLFSSEWGAAGSDWGW
jgi:hypothetical protein